MRRHVHMIEKILSRNDTGETGGHQAGILIPKNKDMLSFFPPLKLDILNPRVSIRFRGQNGESWIFTFVHYNNKIFGGTRNEYRMTGMTQYMKTNNLKSGDKLSLRRDGEGMYHVSHRKETRQEGGRAPLKLSNSWKVIKL